jgi:hypothetical protein
MSVGGKNEKDEGLTRSSIPPGVPPSSPSSPSDENHAQIASDIDGKLDREVEARASSYSPLHTASSLYTEHETAKVGSVADFFYDDSNAPYTPLPEHDLDHSPCCLYHSYKGGLLLLQIAS